MTFDEADIHTGNYTVAIKIIKPTSTFGILVTVTHPQLSAKTESQKNSLHKSLQLPDLHILWHWSPLLTRNLRNSCPLMLSGDASRVLRSPRCACD